MRIPVKQIIRTFKTTHNVSKTASLLVFPDQLSIVGYFVVEQPEAIFNNYRGIFRRSTRPKTIHQKLSISTREQIFQLKQTEHLGVSKHFWPVLPKAQNQSLFHIHKNSPNENAVIERSFKTDQEEFYFWLEKAPEHMGELNEWLQTFINLYNTDRPHQSLDYKNTA